MLSMLDKILQAILKMLKKKDERVLVWSNASPNSSFGPQTIQMALTGYDRIRLESLQNNSSDRSVTVHEIPVGMFSYVGVIGKASSTGLAAVSRTVSVTENSVKFETAYWKPTHSSNAGTAVTDSLIPQKIYGIKSSGGGKLVSLFRSILVKGGVRYAY